MSKRKVTTLVLSVALALLAFGGVFAYSRVSALAATPVAPVQGTQTAPTDPGQPGPQQDKRGGPQDGAARDAELATALGISTEKLQAAFLTANEAAVKAAVSQGLMTQAQADQFSANGLPNHPLRELEGADYDTLLANALGISVEQLQTARQQVKSAHLATQVASGQLTQEQADAMQARDALFANAKFQAGMKSAFEAGVKQAVTDGVVTQTQADQIIEENAAKPGFPGGPDRGGPGGPGGKRGGPGGPGGKGPNN
jgi:hypothetical protein